MLKQVVVLSVSTLLIQGCASTFDTTKAWEKQHLASPLMQRSTEQVTAVKQHTYISKESTQGGFTTGAGGCGCN